MSAQYVVQPYKLAAKVAKLKFEFAFKAMPRLVAMLVSDKESVTGEFRFFTDLNGDKVGLKSKPVLEVLCQRCESMMQLKLDIDTEILLVKTEAELLSLADEVEALVVEDELSLKDLLEDELILAMPLVSKHELAECEAGRFIRNDKLEGTHKPFADLKNIWSN